MSNNNITNRIICGDQNFSVPGHMNYGKLALEKFLKEKEKVALVGIYKKVWSEEKFNSSTNMYLLSKVNGATNEQLTFGELAQQVVNVAASLQELGIKKSDVVAICSENRTEFLIASIASICCGATITYINNAYNKGKLITDFICKNQFFF